MTNEKTTSVPTYVSLCSGYDGIGIGLKRAIPNLRTIAHCEIEAYAVANLIAKMEAGQLDACPVFSDLKTFPYRELRNRVTILSAGFPCQPFSSAGKRQATEDPRHLYPWIADGITAMRPRYVMLENVEGIISAKTGDGESVLKYVLRDLEGRGYSCAWGVFSASEVGASHQRKRVFILAKSSSTGLERATRESVQRRSERLTSTNGEKLGNTSSVGSCGGSTDENGQQSEVSRSGLGKTQYPARPGEEQHEWEEQRTTQSCVGLPTNGTTFRVDELRLLGNGVVPDTCELAFKTLIKQLR